MDRGLLGLPSAQRNLILFLLLAAAAACWTLILAQSGAGRGMSMTMASPTMGLPAPAFVSVWAIMMVAMMFPSAAPMVLTFHRIEGAKRDRGEAFVSTWLFVAGYMVVWGAAGVAAYAGALAAEAVAARAALSAAAAARIGGALLIAAGLYQLTPLKNVCLSKCRSPFGFIVTSWRGGPAGALRMGLRHGGLCFGCCWLLMVVLFPLGIMNLAAMILLTLIIFAEKVARLGAADGLWRRRRAGDLRRRGGGGPAGAADLCRTRRGDGDAGNGHAENSTAGCPDGSADGHAGRRRRAGGALVAANLCHRDRRTGGGGQGHLGAMARQAFRLRPPRYRPVVSGDGAGRARQRRRSGRPGRCRGCGPPPRCRTAGEPAIARRKRRPGVLGRCRQARRASRIARIPARVCGAPAQRGARRRARRTRHRHRSCHRKPTSSCLSPPRPKSAPAAGSTSCGRTARRLYTKMSCRN